MRKLFFLLLFSILVWSCVDSELKDLLDNSEALMQESPDIALSVLQQRDNRNIRSKRLKARHALLLSQAYDKNYIDIASDSLTVIAVNYYGRQRQETLYKLLSYYYQGIVLKNSQSLISSILYFEKAEQVALCLNDYHYLGLIYRNKADIMASMNNSLEAINYTKQAIDYFKRANEMDYAQYARGSLAIFYVNERDFEPATLLIDSLINESPEDSLFLSSILLSYGELLIEQGGATKEAVRLYSNIDSSYFYITDWAYYAYALNSIGAIDSANRVIRQAYYHAGDIIDSATVDGINSRIVASRKQFSKAYRFLDNASHIQDSLSREILHQSANIAQRDFYKEEAKYQALKSHSSTLAAWFLGITCLLLSIIGGLSFGIYKKRKDVIIKDQIAQLAYTHQKANSLTKDNAGILGALLSERLGHLDKLSVEYLSAETQKEKEAIFKEYKKRAGLLKNDDTLIASLEKDLDRFCNGIMTKLQDQVPDIKGENRRIICLFFAGLSNIAVQLITGKVSLKSVEMTRSRCRNIIKSSGAKDTTTFLELLENKKR